MVTSTWSIGEFEVEDVDLGTFLFLTFLVEHMLNSRFTGRRCGYQVIIIRIHQNVKLSLTFNVSCNWLGGHASVLAMDWYGKKRLNAAKFTNMTIKGTSVAAIKNVDNFSFA